MRGVKGRAAIGVLLLGGCSPSTAWQSAPADARSAIVAEADDPIRAFDIDDAWVATFAPHAEVEIAYFTSTLDQMALERGIVPALEAGNPLPNPTAVFRRSSTGGWEPRDMVGTQLAGVRTPRDEVDGCQTFDVRPATGGPVDVLWLLPTGDGRVIMGDSNERIWIANASLERPVRINVANVMGGAPPQFQAGTLAGGEQPFAFGAIDGTLWRGRFVDESLLVEQIATSTTGVRITQIAGTTDPIDLHVLVGGGDPDTDTVPWLRFNKTTWSAVGSLPQLPLAAYFDLEYISADDVFAVAWTDSDGLLHYDGITTERERTPTAVAYVDVVEGIGIVAGGFDALFVRDPREGWQSIATLRNEVYVDEPPHASVPYGAGLLAVGRSYIVQYADSKACPPYYIWPLKRFTSVRTIGRDVIIGAVGDPGSALVRFLRATD